MINTAEFITLVVCIAIIAISQIVTRFKERCSDRQREIVIVQVYVVRKGDSWTKISTLFGTNVETLKRFNGIEEAEKLYEGQIVKVPQIRLNEEKERG